MVPNHSNLLLPRDIYTPMPQLFDAIPLPPPLILGVTHCIVLNKFIMLHIVNENENGHVCAPAKSRYPLYPLPVLR